MDIHSWFVRIPCLLALAWGLVALLCGRGRDRRYQ